MPPVLVAGRLWNVGSDDFVILCIMQILFQCAWVLVLFVPIGVLRADIFACSEGNLYFAFYIGNCWSLATVLPVTFLLMMHSARGSILNDKPRSQVPLLLIIKFVLFFPDVATWAMGLCASWKYWNTCEPVLYRCVLAVSVAQSIYVGGTMLFLWLCFQKKPPSKMLQQRPADVLDTVKACHIVPLDSSSQISLHHQQQQQQYFPELNEHNEAWLRRLSLREPTTKRKTNLDGSKEKGQDEEEEEDESLFYAHIAGKWERRIRLLLCGCCAATEEVDAFRIVAELLSYFTGDVSFVFSDILAGLTLLRSEERQLGATKCGRVAPAVLNQETEPFADDAEEPMAKWLQIPRIAHFFQYAYGCYGWMAYLPLNLCSRKPCQVCYRCKCNCSVCCCHGNSTRQGDTCCSLNTATLLALTGIDESCILFSSHENEVYQSPFFVCTDHQHAAVVICIRGTLSLMDALTDLVTKTDHLTVLEAQALRLRVPQTAIHKGMLLSARRVQSLLQEQGILRQAVEAFPTYDLVITGHSLGAGVASVLSLLLLPEYPQLKCYAYASPLSIMSRELSQFCQTFMVSVVIGYDIFSRLSVTTLEELKYRVSLALLGAKQPKYRIIGHLAHSLCCCCSSHLPLLPNVPADEFTGIISVAVSSEEDTTDCSTSQWTSSNHRSLDVNLVGHLLLHCPRPQGALLMSKGRRWSDSTHLKQKVMPPITVTPSPPLQDFPILQMGGRLLHIVQLEQPMRHSADDPYVALWGQTDRLQTLVIHHNMIRDHMPSHYYRILTKLADQYNTSESVAACGKGEQAGGGGGRGSEFVRKLRPPSSVGCANEKLSQLESNSSNVTLNLFNDSGSMKSKKDKQPHCVETRMLACQMTKGRSEAFLTHC